MGVVQIYLTYAHRRKYGNFFLLFGYIVANVRRIELHHVAFSIRVIEFTEKIPYSIYRSSNAVVKFDCSQ